MMMSLTESGLAQKKARPVGDGIHPAMLEPLDSAEPLLKTQP